MVAGVTRKNSREILGKFHGIVAGGILSTQLRSFDTFILLLCCETSSSILKQPRHLRIRARAVPLQSGAK